MLKEQMSNLVINPPTYVPLPGGGVSDKEMIVGNDDRGVVSLFDPQSSIEEYEGRELPVVIDESLIEVGIDDIGTRDYSFQNLRSVMDRVASESGFVWRVDADRRLIYRPRAPIDGGANRGVIDLSDDPFIASVAIGTELSFSFATSQSANGPISGTLPRELTWQTEGTGPAVTGIQRAGTVQDWKLTTAGSPPLRSDPPDYRSIQMIFARNNSVVARYSMGEIVTAVKHKEATQELFLYIPSDLIAEHGANGWTINFRRGAATYVLPADAHRIDTSKIKNYVRVYGGADFQETSEPQTVTSTQFSSGEPVVLTKAFSKIPGDDVGLRVTYVDPNEPSGSPYSLTVLNFEPQDDRAYDVVWNEAFGTLTFNADSTFIAALIASGTESFVFDVEGWYGLTIFGESRSQPSIDRYGVRSVILVQPELRRRVDADRRALQERREWEDGLEVLSVETDFEDFEVATLVSVRNQAHDLLETGPNFIIESIEITGLAPTQRVYRMKLRRDNFSLESQPQAGG